MSKVLWIDKELTHHFLNYMYIVANAVVLRETTPSSMAVSDLNTIPDDCDRANPRSVVMVLAFGEQGLWFESRPDLIFLPCIYSYVTLLETVASIFFLFVINVSCSGKKDVLYKAGHYIIMDP